MRENEAEIQAGSNGNEVLRDEWMGADAGENGEEWGNGVVMVSVPFWGGTVRRGKGKGCGVFVYGVKSKLSHCGQTVAEGMKEGGGGGGGKGIGGCGGDIMNSKRCNR